MKTKSMTACPRRNQQVLKQEAAGTAVLLDLDDGKYFSLDEVGGRVWDLCDGSRTVREIVTILGEEYDAPVTTIEQDVAELLGDLAKEDLISEW